MKTQLMYKTVLYKFSLVILYFFTSVLYFHRQSIVYQFHRVTGHIGKICELI